MEDQRHDIIPTSTEMAMTIVPVVAVSQASVIFSVHVSPFIPMTLLPFLFQFLAEKLQPRIHFPNASKLTNGGVWTWIGCSGFLSVDVIKNTLAKSNLGEKRIYFSVYFQIAVHQELEAGTEAEIKTLLARALSGSHPATLIIQSRLTSIEMVLCRVATSYINHQSTYFSIAIIKHHD